MGESDRFVTDPVGLEGAGGLIRSGDKMNWTIKKPRNMRGKRAKGSRCWVNRRSPDDWVRSDQIVTGQSEITCSAVDTCEEITALPDISVAAGIGDTDTRGAIAKQDPVLTIGEVENFVETNTLLNAEDVSAAAAVHHITTSATCDICLGREGSRSQSHA